ncbi:M67 family metallopeptidase [Sphingobium sp. V4]|uniref:M67 family metallopeptidase n=1 Tax=Sphingobium sp. V4 TaxID=3038927 RepID=UPI00255813FD|nr:M67 family metallopeptidase [Sphingobium sp. V4]WIW89182.1 M67 family metallopeptidase [Sphingobium sp. V4]
MMVAISRGLLEQIVALGRSSRDEVCGLLFGRAGTIEGFQPAANVAPDPARHFELDPAILIAAHRSARTGGPAIVGHYHSHPSGVAIPSVTDVACASPDGSLWLILGSEKARLWRARPGTIVNVQFVEVMLDIR